MSNVVFQHSRLIRICSALPFLSVAVTVASIVFDGTENCSYVPRPRDRKAALAAALLQSQSNIISLQNHEYTGATSETGTGTEGEGDREHDMEHYIRGVSNRAAMIMALDSKASMLRHHTALLTRSIEAMNRSDPTQSLENLVAKFINSQASSQDKCPAQLLESKRQLTALHYQVRDLAAEVNATEIEETSDIVTLQNVHVEMDEIEGEKQDDHNECKKQLEEDMKTYIILKKELYELWTIANPNVTMDVREASKRLLKEEENSSKKVTTIVTYKRGPVQIFNVSEGEENKYAKWNATYYNETMNKTQFNSSAKFTNSSVTHTLDSAKLGESAAGNGNWSDWKGLVMNGSAPNITNRSAFITSTLPPIIFNKTIGNEGLDKAAYEAKGWTIEENTFVTVEAKIDGVVYEQLTKLPIESVTSAIKSAILLGVNGSTKLVSLMNESDLDVGLTRDDGSEAVLAQIRISPPLGADARSIAGNMSSIRSALESRLKTEISKTPGIMVTGDMKVDIRKLTAASEKSSSLLQEEHTVLSAQPRKPALTSVSAAQGLASKAKSLAVTLASCMKHQHTEGSLLEIGERRLNQVADVCPASSVRVALDGKAADVSTATEFKIGEASIAQCHDLNEKFTGEILLWCKAGFLQPDLTGCKPTSSFWVGENCTTGQGVKVTIDEEQVTFYPYANIPSGSSQAKNCSEIHDNYTGEILLNCRDGLIRPDASGCVPKRGPESEYCEQQRFQLEITYSRAYVELTRLVSEYEEIVNSTVCDTVADENEKEKLRPLKVKLETLTMEIKTITEHMRSYRVQLHDMRQAEAKLTQHVAMLKKKCEDMDETISSLDKVRDAIHVISLCPGIDPSFSVPELTGVAMAFFDNTIDTDEQIDMKMNGLCANDQNKEGPTPRAAETSEIELKTILNAPNYNTAEVPLMGTCPNCRGLEDSDDTDPKHVSGYARICWDPGEELLLSKARRTCGKGKKAVLCVVDRPDPSGGQFTPPPGGWDWQEGAWT